MLKSEENRILTRVGPGTPMGELEEQPTRPVRLLGEDLVLYKDKGGTYGLLDRHCPHRRADMSYGFVEECGLRCNYHGWKFDASGRCLHQPFEEVALYSPEFVFQAGQPEEITQAYRQAMGMDRLAETSQ